MNKSINIKEEILNSFRENYEQKDGEWGYHGWVEETGFGEVYSFLSNSLDRMREETIYDISRMWNKHGATGFARELDGYLEEKPKA